MSRYFNVTGACDQKYHYMVDLQPRLLQIKKLIAQGAYFTINRARQYGKTTTLQAIRTYLADDYQILSLDFQMLSHNDFDSEKAFVKAFCNELLACLEEQREVSETF